MTLIPIHSDSIEIFVTQPNGTINGVVYHELYDSYLVGNIDLLIYSQFNLVRLMTMKIYYRSMQLGYYIYINADDVNKVEYDENPIFRPSMKNACLLRLDTGATVKVR